MDKYVIFHIDGGAGKSVAATAVCTSIKAAFPDHKIVVVTAWPEVFLNNSTIFRVYKTGNFAYFYDDFIKNKDSIILRSDPYHTEDFIYKRKHLIEIWCDVLGIPCVSLQPQLVLTQREMANAVKVVNKQGPLLLMHTNGGADDNIDYSWARDLPQVFAQHLVDKVKGNFNKILHVRKEKQLPLSGTIQVTDSLRNLFCYVLLADKLILIDSLIQHVAAAFNKSSAVAWIANSPTVFGYNIHKNILPSQMPSFRHNIDSYLDDCDWMGRRFYECPYDDINNIFSEQPFLDYLIPNDLTFDKMPEQFQP